jgi:outer membrane murein-binding lipoprotein Lpp
LSGTESKLRAAEEQLRQIETEVRALRIERDRVRRESETAAAQVLDAKKAAALAESKLDRPTGS